MRAVHHVQARTEDVGTWFTDEVRRMHYGYCYGEQEARSICAQAGAREALALTEEGIETTPLPLSAVVKETPP